MYLQAVHAHTRFKGQGHILTNCLHHAQLGCERMHFWQEGAGWQDPGRDRSACSHSAAPFADAVSVSDSVSPPHRTSRRMRTAGESTMVCIERQTRACVLGRAWLVVALLNSAPHLPSEFHIPYGFSSCFKIGGVTMLKQEGVSDLFRYPGWTELQRQLSGHRHWVLIRRMPSHPGFHSQAHMACSSQLSVAPVPGDPTHSLASKSTGHTCGAQTYIG